jgi:hypothetical protein
LISIKGIISDAAVTLNRKMDKIISGTLISVLHV